MKNPNPIWMLMLFVAVCFVAAGAGAIFTGGSDSSWYPALRQPAWNPPAWIFEPVWTLLHLVMATAAWLVWHRRGFDARAGALSLVAFPSLFHSKDPSRKQLPHNVVPRQRDSPAGHGMLRLL